MIFPLHSLFFCIAFCYFRSLLVNVGQGCAQGGGGRTGCALPLAVVGPAGFRGGGVGPQGEGSREPTSAVCWFIGVEGRVDCKGHFAPIAHFR